MLHPPQYLISLGVVAQWELHARQLGAPSSDNLSTFLYTEEEFRALCSYMDIEVERAPVDNSDLLCDVATTVMERQLGDHVTSPSSDSWLRICVFLTQIWRDLQRYVVDLM